ncbi:MAG: dihydropteroate synthase [Pseudomonadota bacterium]
MIHNPRVLRINSREEIERELEEMGVDPSSIDSIFPKMLHFNLKLQDVDRKAANILREEMRQIGGDFASAPEAINHSVESTDVILSGNYHDFERLIEKVKDTAFGLDGLRDDIQEAIDNHYRDGFVVRCKKTDLKVSERTHIMGVINVTPDSFSDGGLFFDSDRAVAHGLQLVDQGADIIDIGGETTRPGSTPISAEAEINRVIPVIERLAPRTAVPISVDTYKSVVAEKAIEAGAEIINDISGLHFDPKMAEIAAHYDVPIVLMHIRGTPLNMQQNPFYKSLTGEIIEYLRESIEMGERAGVDPDKIIIDPGIGFGKSLDEGHNLRIISKLSEFKSLGKPILVGPSRKAFIGKILDCDVTEREEGTAAAVSAAILNGANIVRVHNVGMMKKVVKVVDAIKKSTSFEKT